MADIAADQDSGFGTSGSVGISQGSPSYHDGAWNVGGWATFAILLIMLVLAILSRRYK